MYTSTITRTHNKLAPGSLYHWPYQCSAAYNSKKASFGWAALTIYPPMWLLGEVSPVAIPSSTPQYSQHKADDSWACGMKAIETRKHVSPHAQLAALYHLDLHLWQPILPGSTGWSHSPGGVCPDLTELRCPHCLVRSHNHLHKPVEEPLFTDQWS